MRLPTHVLRSCALLLVLGVATHAYADDRSDARAHYQTAAKLYANSDYRGAIREFSQAQQLFPADLNNYNLALCYDKLGDAEPALQYYRAFLEKQPNSIDYITAYSIFSHLPEDMFLAWMEEFARILKWAAWFVSRYLARTRNSMSKKQNQQTISILA